MRLLRLFAILLALGAMTVATAAAPSWAGSKQDDCCKGGK